jgi:RNA polymerase sigma factor (sigma-70 family)
MSGIDDLAQFREWYRMLVSFGVRQGARWSDAEDAAQTVLMRMFKRETEVRDSRRYLFKAMKNELIAMSDRQRRDVDRAQRWMCGASDPVDLPTVEVDEADLVRECLAMLPEQRRRIAAWLCDGYRPDEIAGRLAISPLTVYSHKRNARDQLEPWLSSDGHDLRRWMAVGERMYQAMIDDEPLPVRPRPMIRQAWTLLKKEGLDHRHGAQVQVGRDEVARRRRQSPVAACSWVLGAIVELAAATNQMAVIADRDGVVLWRGGASNVLEAADDAAFVEGACWDLWHAGSNGIALCLRERRPVTVSQWEHYMSDQQRLTCVAAPVLHPRDGRVLCALNLTTFQPIVPYAIQRKVNELALQVHRQLRQWRTQ